MAQLQQYFLKFHEDIKLSNVDENQTLRDKRDLLLRELGDYLPDDAPSWRTFNQGSYAMGTGICPPDGNFDIDVGIVFDCESSDYPDPVVLKEMVRDALSHPNRTVRIRRPCVTVEYIKNGKVDFHVDLAVYAERVDSDTLDLAMGREHSSADLCVWSEQDPQGLIEAVKSRFSGADAEQFRRCIRYLKRWRNEQFKNGGAPLSVALTCAAYHWFSPKKDATDSAKYSDAYALRALVDKMLDNFSIPWLGEGPASRLKIKLPVTPGVDLLETMTGTQMTIFKEKLEYLRDALVSAMNEPLPEAACEILEHEFGSEFPVPTAEETAKKVSSPVVSTGKSA